MHAHAGRLQIVCWSLILLHRTQTCVANREMMLTACRSGHAGNENSIRDFVFEISLVAFRPGAQRGAASPRLLGTPICPTCSQQRLISSSLNRGGPVNHSWGGAGRGRLPSSSSLTTPLHSTSALHCCLCDCPSLPGRRRLARQVVCTAHHRQPRSRPLNFQFSSDQREQPAGPGRGRSSLPPLKPRAGSCCRLCSLHTAPYTLAAHCTLHTAH